MIKGEGTAELALASAKGVVAAGVHPVHPKTKQARTLHFAMPAGDGAAAGAAALGASADTEAGAAADGPAGSLASSLLLWRSGGADAALFALMGRVAALVPVAAASP